jgi:hypothetical protein
MDHDHKSLATVPTATTDDLRLGQYNTCPSPCRAFYTAQDRPLEENLGEIAGGPVNRLVHHP